MRIKQFARTFGWTKKGQIKLCSVKRFVTGGVPLRKIAPSLLHPVRIFIIRYVWSDIHIHVLYAHLSYQHNPFVVSLVTVSIKILDVSTDHKYIYIRCIAYLRRMVLVHGACMHIMCKLTWFTNMFVRTTKRRRGFVTLTICMNLNLNKCQF